MKSRCKMKCVKAEDIGQALAYVFTVVVGNKDMHPENDRFFKFTPSGQLTLSVVNPDVVFLPGKEYHIDISPAVVMGSEEEN